MEGASASTVPEPEVTMIPLREQELLRDRFATELTAPLRIDFFTQKQTGIHIPGREECLTCNDAQALMEELAAISGGRISLTVYDLYADHAAAVRNRVDKVPCAAIRGYKNRRIRHYGLPITRSLIGLAELIDGLMHMASGGTHLSRETSRQLHRLDKEVHVEVLVGKQDPYSPGMVHLGYQFAAESERLRVDIVELEEFPRLAQRYQIQALPTVVLNERLFCVGLLEEERFVEQIRNAAAGRLLQPPPGPAVALAPARPEPGQPSGQQLPSGLILP